MHLRRENREQHAARFFDDGSADGVFLDGVDDRASAGGVGVVAIGGGGEQSGAVQLLSDDHTAATHVDDLPQHNSDGSLKDTARNIQETGEFVVSLVSYAMVGQMNATSFSFDADSSEFDAVGVESAPSHIVSPPRVASSPMSFECRASSFTLHPAAHPTCSIIIGEVLAAHADPAIVSPDGVIDPMRLDLVSRMGADWYGRTKSQDNFSLQRPTGWAR